MNVKSVVECILEGVKIGGLWQFISAEQDRMMIRFVVMFCGERYCVTRNVHRISEATTVGDHNSCEIVAALECDSMLAEMAKLLEVARAEKKA